jgi:hypothetical protein
VQTDPRKAFSAPEGWNKIFSPRRALARAGLAAFALEVPMLLYWRKGSLEFTTDVEEWMADQTFTEVFRYRGEASEEEKEITHELDHILSWVRYGKRGIEETLNYITEKQGTMVSGRAKVGEQSRGSAEGNAVDGVFKERLEHALAGRLKRWRNMLSCTPVGTRGADVISRSLGVAWDVTTVNEVWKHVERDVFGKRAPGKPRIGDLWDRYYLLVWDEPRTNRTSTVQAIAAGRISG